MNSVAYLPQSKRLLEQVSEVLRYEHYSLKTEQAYLYWVRFFVRWHGRDGQMRHPRGMGGAEVTQFLTMLANERRVSVSTHNQALSALLFLYRKVLANNLPWLTEVQRPTRPRRIPSVLTKAEVASLLGAMSSHSGFPGIPPSTPVYYNPPDRVVTLHQEPSLAPQNAMAAAQTP